MISYDAMCNEAVKRFIRTVAIIDDAVSYDDMIPPGEDKEKTKTIIPPITRLTSTNLDITSPVTNKGSIGTGFQDNKTDFSVIDAKAVINAFADMNVACCIQRPKHEEAPLERALKLAVSVDVLILDWVLDKSNVSLPRDIIKRILEKDKSVGSRMRLIVIYTAQPHIDQMLKDLKEDAEEVYDSGLIIDKEHFFIKTDSLRIVFLNKIATKNPLREARIVPFDKLPDNIVLEYVELVKGIIPCTTLHGIAATREKTHELLSILNGNLDGAYCLHRALLREPSDSVDFALNLITSEIGTVIQSDEKARQFVDREGLKAWLIQYAGDEEKLPYYKSSLSVRTIANCILNGQLSKEDGVKTIQKEYALNWVQAETDNGRNLKNDRDEDITLNDAMELIRNNKWNLIKGCKPPNKLRFAEALYSTPKDAISGCNTLSHLQCTSQDTVDRSYMGSSSGPTIKLGSILKVRKRIKDTTVDEWYLCITPLCDCVDLMGKTNFLFLRLYAGKKNSVDIIIEIAKGTFEHLAFKLKNKKIELLTIPFDPINSDRIRTYSWHNQWRFNSNGISYQWVAELRHTKTLSIVHQVAANTFRVGIDEFEWLRRQATLKN